MEQFNNDSTSITVHGRYEDATGGRYRGKPTLAITFGHSKDHRPDLKQIVLILTTTADGAVPVWVEIARKPNSRMKDGPPDVIWSIPSPIEDSDGFRVVWYLSSHKQERDSLWRRNAMQTAIVELGKLKKRLDGARPRFRSQSSVYAAAEAIVKKCGGE